MKQYEKPTINKYEIITDNIASGLADFLNDAEMYEPGITTFVYTS